MNLLKICEELLIDLVLAQIVAAFISDECLVIGEDQSLVIVVLIMSWDWAESQRETSSDMDYSHEIVLFSQYVGEVFKIIVREFVGTHCIGRETLA